MKMFRPHTICAAIAAVAAIAVTAAPSASADVSHISVSLNEQSGVLSIAGAQDDANYAKVWKQPLASEPGGYALVIQTETNATLPNFSANCYIGGGYIGWWQVFCPALNAKRIAFDGGPSVDNFINWTTLPSVAHGGPGPDDFEGGTGADVFYGGADNDVLNGRGGDDTLDGGAGFDTISGGLGSDIASWADATGPVTATLDGAANDGQAGENENIPADVEGIQGGPYGDKLSSSGRGGDILLGGGGPDDLHGGGVGDTLRGQDGNDTLSPTSGAVLDGGPGTDSLSYANYGQAVYVYQDGIANDGALGDQDNVTSIEHLTGTAYGDDLEGTSGDDLIHGGAGNDKIDAKFGNDVVYGDVGSDNIIGGPGAPTDCGNLPCTKFDTDVLDGGPGSYDAIDYSQRSDNGTIALDGSQRSGGFMENDTLIDFENAVGGGGDDTIYGNDAANSLNGGPGADGIAGRGGNDYVAGDEGPDYLDGGQGNDWITGGEGNDRLEAAGGNDKLYGGPGTDTAAYDNATAGVIAHLGTGTSGQAGEADTIDSDVENLEGSPYNDQLYGNSGPNKLLGDNGSDLLVGGGGADNLQGGSGPDTLNTSGDGLKDNSSCGAGTDIANADKLDAIAPDCETVHHS
jgi:Ca2+-binding RTX toxin-like protein